MCNFQVVLAVAILVFLRQERAWARWQVVPITSSTFLLPELSDILCAPQKRWICLGTHSNQLQQTPISSIFLQTAHMLEPQYPYAVHRTFSVLFLVSKKGERLVIEQKLCVSILVSFCLATNIPQVSVVGNSLSC